MSLTADQRREINRENAKKSTGPKSDQGKAKVRTNALKHGLRAGAVALPNEDASEVAARAQSWNDYYRPESPAAQHLVNECVRATLLADRVARYHDAALAKQVRDAVRGWDRGREDEVERLNALLPAEPAEAVRLLKRSAHGCRSLLARWERLRESFEHRGHWLAPERDEVILLRGATPDLASLKTRPEAYLVRFYNFLSREQTRDFAAEEVRNRELVHDAIFAAYARAELPTIDAARAAIRAMVREEVTALYRLEAELLDGHDVHDRTSADDRALILRDEKEARLFLRYQAESRTAFQRAYGTLVKTLRLDEERAPEAEAGVETIAIPGEETTYVKILDAQPTAEAPSPNKANPAAHEAPPAAEAPSPNKANPAEGEASPNPEAPSPNRADAAERPLDRASSSRSGVRTTR